MSRTLVSRLHQTFAAALAALGIGVYHDVLASGTLGQCGVCQ